MDDFEIRKGFKVMFKDGYISFYDQKRNRAWKYSARKNYFRKTMFEHGAELRGMSVARFVIHCINRVSNTQEYWLFFAVISFGPFLGFIAANAGVAWFGLDEKRTVLAVNVVVVFFFGLTAAKLAEKIDDVFDTVHSAMLYHYLCRRGGVPTGYRP